MHGTGLAIVTATTIAMTVARIRTESQRLNEQIRTRMTKMKSNEVEKKE
ncbi:hypothetical protein AAIE21_01990 [Paenibacillus sp. 102]|nr:hypothetical protein [Bacillus sp. LS15-K4]